MSEPLIIMKPGRKGGPCAKRYCSHEWCARDRRIAETQRCTICGDAIGFEALFLAEPAGAGDFAPTIYTHNLCAAAESVRAEKFHP